MKTITLYLLFVLSTINIAFGQSVPQGISYQAVAIKKQNIKLAGENLNQIYWANKNIQVRFSIFETYPGSIEFSETHETKTDDFGVFNLVIGQGTKLSGDFSQLNWELGNAHLQVEIDFEGYGNFELIGVEKFWSVPYAFVPKSLKFDNSKNDSLINDLKTKFDYLKIRDKDTLVGNEGGISFQTLDSLNQILLDSIAALNSKLQLDKDLIIGNEFQNLSLKGDSLSISNGNSIKLLDENPTNELQELTLQNDSLGLTKGIKKIATSELFKNINQNSGFSTSGDSSYNLILSKGVKIKRFCEPTVPNYFGLGNVTIREFVEYNDSVYYIGYYYATNGSKGEFVVSQSKQNCGAKLIFKTTNTDYFYNFNNGISLSLGQYKNKINFLTTSNDRTVAYINTFNIQNRTVNTVKLNPPVAGTQGFTKDISNILAWYSFKDTIYLIYNNLISAGGSTFNGPNRLYKFNINNGNPFYIDSVNDYSDFGVGSNSNGSIQFFDSSMLHSNPITQEIHVMNLFTLSKNLIFNNPENYSNSGAPNIYGNFFFRYFPNTHVLFIPETNSTSGNAIIYDIKSKRTIIESNWFKQKNSSTIITGRPFIKNLDATKKYYVEYDTDWNTPYFYIIDPILSFYK